MLWSDDPFTTYARPEKVFLDGALVFDKESGLKPKSDFRLGYGGGEVMTILSKLTRYIAAALLLGTIYAPASAQDYFISNAKLVTNGSDNIVEDADIVIRSGKIVQIGSNLVAPADATLSLIHISEPTRPY